MCLQSYAILPTLQNAFGTYKKNAYLCRTLKPLLMESSSTVILIAAIAPALILGYYIYRRDKYEREPVTQLIKGFMFGFISVLFAGTIERMLINIGLAPEKPQTIISCIYDAFVGVALVEEGVKLFFLWLLLRGNHYFDEMIDGVVYAAMVGLGFAAAENISYLIYNIESWQSVAVSRAIFAVPAHFMFAVAMGYYYSKQHFYRVSFNDKAKVLLVPILLHGTYDAILMIISISHALAGVLFLFFCIFCYLMYKVTLRRIDNLLKDDEMKNKVKDITLYL